MNPPTVTRAQLEPLIERLLEKTHTPQSLILVRGNPEHAPRTVSVQGRAIEVLASSSPLEIRARACKRRTAPLVVISGCDTASLGDDLIASALRRRVHTVDRWWTVSQLFGADKVARSLSQHRAVADALIEAKPKYGYRPVINKILDLDTALAVLCRVRLNLQAGTLSEFLVWTESEEAARAVRYTAPSLLELLEEHLHDRFGPGVKFAFASLRAELAADLTALAVAAEVMYHPEVDDMVGKIKLEVALGEPDLPNTAYRALAAIAVERLWSAPRDRTRAAWLARADEKLDEFRCGDHAWRSDILPSGFTQRLNRAAKAIERWRSVPHDTALAYEVEESIALAKTHLRNLDEPYRVERLQMATRMIRRMTLDPLPGVATTLDETVTWYVRDGSWFDRARILVSRGDTAHSVRELCKALTTQADLVADNASEAVALRLAAAAHPLDGLVLGIEHVLDRVVAPVATDVRLLVLVLDGMGWPTFLEILERIEHDGWQPQRRSGMPSVPAAVAVLPTVTELSRTSLLCGTLRTGDMDTEQRLFAARPSLQATTSRGRPPLLFHKTDLRKGGLDTLPYGVLDTILESGNRVVGLVLNNIDERLKDVSTPPGGWSLDELAPMREVLDAARRSGRAIVLTGDHGHVLERGSERRNGGGGTRWRRSDTGSLGEGEIRVQGARVLTADGAAILPWREKLRYGPLSNGYHGGLTAAEAVVPVVILSTDSIPGWDPAIIAPPAWWYPASPDPESSWRPATETERPCSRA